MGQDPQGDDDAKKVASQKNVDVDPVAQPPPSEGQGQGQGEGPDKKPGNKRTCATFILLIIKLIACVSAFKNFEIFTLFLSIL